MPDWASEMLRYGPLGAFALAICWGGWRVIVFVGHKLFDDDKGYVPVWVKSELLWRDKLTERLGEQQKTCSIHNETLTGVAKLVSDQLAIGVVAKDNAIEAALAAHSANATLTSIDTTLTERTKILQGTGDDVVRLKQAALRACDLCRFVAEKECPNSAAAVEGHLVEIERIIGEA